MKKMLIVLCMVLAMGMFSGCGEKERETEDELVIDYGDEKSFEMALNEGKNLEGKIVRFSVKEFHPNSEFGYNLWAGEHLNFVSQKHPNVEVDDIVTVRVTSIKSISGSWIINYKKVDNAIMDEDTIVYKDTDNSASGAGIEKPSIMTEEEEDAGYETETERHESIFKVLEDVEDTKSIEDTENIEDTKNIGNTENTYENNEYYDLVETANITSYNYTIIIHKVLAKQDASLQGTLLAFDGDDNVIGKSSDSIVLIAGQYNYFKYTMEGKLSNVKIEASYKTNGTPVFDEGERNAVEMVKYNQSKNHLYVTLKQVSENLDWSAKFKLLLYKDDKIVGEESGYFSISAENLSGKDTTDIMDLWLSDKKYDKVEYIFEP